MGDGSGYNAKTEGSQVVRDLKDVVTGRVFFITGGTAGIGRETAALLAEQGAIVIITGRSDATIKPAIELLKERVPAATVHGLACDLSSLKSIRECAKNFASLNLSLHVLINNAGIMGCPASSTVDGFEMQFGTNHVGHFLLTDLLLLHLLKTAKQVRAAGGPANSVRIINVSSIGNWMLSPKEGIDFKTVAKVTSSYNEWHAYGQSKLANALHARELQRRLDAGGNSDVLALALHPGAIMSTSLSRHVGLRSALRFLSFGKVWRFAFSGEKVKTLIQGTTTTLVAALLPSVQKNAFYSDSIPFPSRLHEQGTNDELAAKLWTFTEKLIAEAESNAPSSSCS